MQTRAPATADKYHPPTAPHIPLQAIQSLIPRITTTINDIDSLKALLGQGAQDGSLPNWETLLQRYSLLLGRVNALSHYLAQPAPRAGPSTGPNKSAPDPRPALDRYLVHPLNPLPPNPDSPLAPEAFFQVINSQSLPAVTDGQARLLSPANRAAGQDEWVALPELRGMSDAQLAVLGRKVRGRLEREHTTAAAVREMLERHEEEYEWGMRVGGGDEDDEEVEGGAGGGGRGEKEQDEDDDLFGDEDDAAPAPGPKATGLAPNPREGWSVADYMRYMDTGTEPKTAGSAA